MRVLALDTTTAEGSVAVVDDDRVLVERRGSAVCSHTERLPTDLLTALADCGLTPSDVDIFAVASGPGSFTGIRTGIATIQGMAFVTKRQVVPVSALTALAVAAALECSPGAIVGAWMDAHRREVFSALFLVQEGPSFGIDRLQAIDPPAAGDPAETLARWVDASTIPACVVGDGAVLYASTLAARTRVVPPPALASVIGRIAVACARAGGAVDPAGVQPFYVRRPDVEVARDRAR